MRVRKTTGNIFKKHAAGNALLKFRDMTRKFVADSKFTNKNSFIGSQPDFQGLQHFLNIFIRVEQKTYDTPGNWISFRHHLCSERNRSNSHIASLDLSHGMGC